MRELSRSEKIGYILYFHENEGADLDLNAEHKFFAKKKELDYEIAYEMKSDWDRGLHSGDCICATCSCIACDWGEIQYTATRLIPIPQSPYGYKPKEAFEIWFFNHFFIKTPTIKSNGISKLKPVPKKDEKFVNDMV